MYKCGKYKVSTNKRSIHLQWYWFETLLIPKRCKRKAESKLKRAAQHKESQCRLSFTSVQKAWSSGYLQINMATADTNTHQSAQSQRETIVLPLLVVQPIDRLSFADLQITAHPNCIKIGRPFVNYSQLVEIDANKTVSIDCDSYLQFCGVCQSAANLLPSC